MNTMQLSYRLLILIAMACTPFCASSAWREGFKGDDTLYLVGSGKAQADLPQVQRDAMAREAAVMDAMGHWPRFCPAQTSDDGVQSFRIENQKKRSFECDGGECRARIVIEKRSLRAKCKS